MGPINIGTLLVRVKVEICRRVPSFNEILSSFMSIGTTVTELHEFEEKRKPKKNNNMDKIGKLVHLLVILHALRPHGYKQALAL